MVQKAIVAALLLKISLKVIFKADGGIWARSSCFFLPTVNKAIISPLLHANSRVNQTHDNVRQQVAQQGQGPENHNQSRQSGIVTLAD